ncbi:MAG: hypothetical protein DMD68_03700 [Gemmatimonadetes bacterium]|nr:MAG: hypothetical protein DMD74_11075 [Gemmatimonadota bacterium]PYO85415.1 MAG: hypothetical protein DMD68_03700 [Gemmatimonadota bacterium]
MPHARVVTLLALIALGGVTAVGCGLTDVFSPAGLKSIVVAYQGDSVVAPGATIPFTVTVRVGGALQPTPSLSVISIDTAILVVTVGQDSLRGVSIGWDTLTIRLVSSIFTDSAPTIRQAIRVRP